MNTFDNCGLYLDNNTEEYYFYNYETGKIFYVSKKLNKLIHQLKSKSWKYNQLSGECDNKIEEICRKELNRRRNKK